MKKVFLLFFSLVLLPAVASASTISQPGQAALNKTHAFSNFLVGYWLSGYQNTEAKEPSIVSGSLLTASCGGWNWNGGGNFDNPPAPAPTPAPVPEPSTAPVPEPATMFLLGTGLLGFVGVSKRKKKIS